MGRRCDHLSPTFGRTWSPASHGQRLDQSSASELESMLLWTWSFQSLNRTRCPTDSPWRLPREDLPSRSRTRRQLDGQTKNFRPLCQRRRRRRRNLRRSRTGLLRTTSHVERLEQSRDPETKQCMVTLPNAVRAASCSGTVPDMYERRTGPSSGKSARQRQQHCAANAQDDHAWSDGMVTQHGAWLLSTSSLKKLRHSSITAWFHGRTTLTGDTHAPQRVCLLISDKFSPIFHKVDSLTDAYCGTANMEFPHAQATRGLPRRWKQPCTNALIV